MQMKISQLHLWSYYFDFASFPIMIFATILIIFIIGIPHLYLAWFTLGLAGWPLFEYLFHRCAFHGFIFARAHYLHHTNPAGYIGVSSLVTTTTYILGMSLSLWIDMPIVAILLVGLSLGYLTYIFVHHQIHHGKYAGRYLDSARTRHNRHHSDAQCDFGVTVSFWDRVFDTQSANY
jgi:sterol desaturase/sphingolipid hydroxylase (fatty acid hydroxylase superfamily)